MAISLRVQPILSNVLATSVMLQQMPWSQVYTVFSPDVVALSVLAAVQEGSLAEWTWAENLYKFFILSIS